MEVKNLTDFKRLPKLCELHGVFNGRFQSRCLRPELYRIEAFFLFLHVCSSLSSIPIIMLNSTQLPRPPLIGRIHYCKITQQNIFLKGLSDCIQNKNTLIQQLFKFSVCRKLQPLHNHKYCCLQCFFQKGFVRKQLKEIESQIESAGI